MNYLTFIVGPSGGGKTTSLRHLGPEAVIFNTEKKSLPFEAAKGAKAVTIKTVDELTHWLTVAGKRDDIKIIVVDSFSAIVDQLLSYARDNFKNFDIWNDYNAKIGKFFDAVKEIENKYIFITGHNEMTTTDDGGSRIQMAVKGNEWGKVGVEKEATCVFYSAFKKKTDGTPGVTYHFITNTDGKLSAKTPMGMFSDFHIPNDVAEIVKVYDKFWKDPTGRVKEAAAKAAPATKPAATTVAAKTVAKEEPAMAEASPI